MEVSTSVLDMIGNTPIVEAKHLDAGPCRIFLKLENQNPGGSIKDRIGLAMIEAAERDGKLKPGGTIIEATAGNTGLGLALVAAQKGYRMVLIIPDKMSPDKIRHLEALGAEIILTRSDVGKGHPDYYHDMAERIFNGTPGAFLASQFDNPANPLAHETGTGPEIWEQMDGKVDALVAGVGSGGTISGTGRYLKSRNPDVSIVAADPEGSVIATAVKTGKVPEDVGSWLVEGIGEDFIPVNCDLSVIDDAETVTDQEAFEAERALLQKEGILGGTSTGTLIASALKWARKQTEPKNIVTFVCDTGNKYLSKGFNQGWLLDNGLIKREERGDLRDLINRRADQGGVVAVGPEDRLQTAYNRMRMYDISQLPVIENEQLVGIIDESDLLSATWNHADRFASPVSEIMTSDLDKVQVSAPVSRVMDMINDGKTPIVEDGETFLGFITRVDLINHMRRKAA